MTRTFRISNDLYGNSIASAHELAKGYTRPVIHDTPQILPDEIRIAHEEIVAKRKLNLILRSKVISEIPVRVGDVVQVFVRHQNQKRGRWSPPVSVIYYDHNSRTVTVPSSQGRTRKAAIEDVRHAILDSPLAIEVQHAIDTLDAEIEEQITPTSSCVSPVKKVRFNIPDDHSDKEDVFGQISAGDQIEQPTEMNDDVDAVTYIPAVTSTFDPEAETQEGNNEHNATLVPDPSHSAEMSRAKRFSLPSAPSVHPMTTRTQAQGEQHDHQNLQANEIELLPGTELTNQDQEALHQYHDRFKSKEFLLNKAEGLPSFITDNAYKAEEERFLKECKMVHRSAVPRDANLIRSHVLYKVKRRDDDSLTCKARIAPHGNEDKERSTLRTDSASCPPLGIRVLFSLCVIFQWYITKIDIKSAFLQSGRATRDVYVIPPRECKNRAFVWLLTVATYGLVNANAKWQHHSDNTFIDLGLSTTPFIPQFFFFISAGLLKLVLVKIADDLFIARDDQFKKEFIKKLGKVYTLGTITHLLGSCLFFGLEVSQDENFIIRVHADHKLNGITPHKLSHARRKQSDDSLNAIETFHYNSVNGSIGFVGVHACPIAMFVSSFLQQRRNRVKVKDLAVQSSMLKKLIQLGSIATYCRPSHKENHQLSVLLFSDAGRPSEYGQLGFVSGLLIGDLQKESAYHVLSWSSSLSRRPAKSTGSAEILAAGSAIDEGILIGSALSDLLGVKIPVIVAVDSKDLFDSLTSCHVPEDKSIRSDVQQIRYYFKTKQINKMIWIPGSVNLADPLTKKDSRLSDALQLLLFSGMLPFDFPEVKTRNSKQSLG